MTDKAVLIRMRQGALLGMFTGLIGSLLVPLADAGLDLAGVRDADLGYIYSVGLSFGLGLGLYLGIKYSLRIWQIAFCVFVTPAMYYTALMSAIFVYDFVYDKVELGHEMVVPGLVGGAIGAGLVALMVCAFVRPSNWMKLTLLVILTGAITPAIALPLSGTGPDLVGMLILHVPWHAAVLAVLLSQLARAR